MQLVAWERHFDHDRFMIAPHFRCFHQGESERLNGVLRDGYANHPLREDHGVTFFDNCWD